MPHHDLDVEFHTFRAEVSTLVRAPGLEAAREVARRRRATKYVAVIGAVVMVAAGLVGVGQAAGQRSAAPRPLPSGSAPPNPYPTSRGRIGFCPPASMPAPAGAVTVAELCNARLDLPAWPPGSRCPAGAVRFANGSYLIDAADPITLGAFGGQPTLHVAYAANDDLIVQVNCEAGGIESQLLLVRDVGGSSAVVGRVIGTGDHGTGIEALLDYQVLPDGDVRVQVADVLDGTRQVQWRVYHRTGNSFAQVGGPTTFPPNAHLADLSVTSTNAVFGSAAAGKRTGALTVTIRNAGPARAQATLFGQLLPFVEVVSPPSGCVTEATDHTVQCDTRAIKSGGSVTLTFHLRAPADADRRPIDSTPRFDVGVRGGTTDLLADPRHDNDSVGFNVVFP